MPPSSIVVLGSVNTDLVIRGPRLPSPGETVLGGEFYRANGGKGANQAVAAARASGDGPVVTFMGAVGDDAFGREALKQFSLENLDCQYIKTVNKYPSGVALILVDRKGENLISVASGANLHFTARDVDDVPLDVFKQAKVFLTCLESPPQTVARGLTQAASHGLKTILNPAPADREIVRIGALSFVDIITPNAGEAAALTGIDTSDDEGAVNAAKKLRTMGCRNCIITLGERGCVIVEKSDVTWEKGCKVEPVDATAAGDAFNGALAVALAEGRSLVEAAGWANRAAAIAVTRAGAQPSLPTREEIDSFNAD